MVEIEVMDDHAVFRERFGARLRALRLEAGWTAAEVADRIGCTIGNYYKLERGAVDIGTQLFLRLRNLFRLDEVDFYTFPDANPLRHGIYELLRKAPEEVLLKTKLFVLEELRRQGTPSSLTPAPAHDAADDQPKAPQRRQAANGRSRR